MNKYKRRLYKAGIITLFLTGLYTWGIPAAINLPVRKVYIQEKIQQNTGYIFDLGHPQMKMGAFPSVWVSSDYIKILNNDGSQALYFKNPKLKLSIVPLLFNKIVISHVYADREEINFVLNNNRQFMLGQYPLVFNKNGKFKLTKIDWNLGKYDINLDDKLNNQKTKLSGKYISNGVYVANKRINVSTEGTLDVGGKTANYMIDTSINLPIDKFSQDKFRINSKIENFDLDLISDYASILSNGVIQKTSGVFTLNANTVKTAKSQKRVTVDINTKNLLIQGKDKVSVIKYYDPLNFSLNFITVNNGFKFENTTFDGKNVHAKFNGDIIRHGGHFPYFDDFVIEVEKTRLEELCSLFPWSKNLVRDMDFYAVKKYKMYGNGQGELKLNGAGGLKHYPKLYGYVRLDDVYVTDRIKGTSRGADVKLDMHGHNMDVDVFVPATNNQNVCVKGVAKIDGSKYSELHITSSDSVVMETALHTLNALHEILKFKLGPVPIMRLKGFGSIDVRSAGKKVDPHLFGAFKFRRTTASFKRINNLELTNASGEVLFNDTKIPFKTYHAMINGLPASISGDCDVNGNLNVNASTSGQSIRKILPIINSSDDLKEVQKVIKSFKDPSGIADIMLNIYGVAKDAETVKFNKDVFAKGKISLHNAKTTLQDTFLPITNINGFVNFEKQNADYDVTGFVRNSKLHVTGTANTNNMDLTLSTDKFLLSDCFDMLYPQMNIPFKKDIGRLNTSFIAKYNGSAVSGSNSLDYNKIIVNGKLLSNMNSSNIIKTNGGKYTISKGALSVSHLTGLFNDTPFSLKFSGNNIYKSMNLTDGKFNLKNFDISGLNNLMSQSDASFDLQHQLAKFDNIKGIVDIAGSINNGNINADTDLKNVSFVYKPYNAIIRVASGASKMRGNVLYLDKINSSISSMPVLLDGSISDIYTQNPNLNLYINAKPTQAFFDRFVNSRFIYPVKMKGDVNLSARLNGRANKLKAHSILDIKENSSIYYMGATISGASTGMMSSEGVTTNPVSLVFDGIVSPNKIYINSFDYNQVITSQNKKKSIQKQLGISGEISILKDNVLKFNNLKIKTKEPTNAKIFNILLKKPTVKQGVFTSDLLVNGTSLSPYILGKLNISSVDVPLLDATIKDIDIDFQKDYINLNSKGIILTNDIVVDSKIVNSFQAPYVVEDLNVVMDLLDLNVIAERFNDFDAEHVRTKKAEATNTLTLPQNQVVIKNGSINADKIVIKKAQASDFHTHFTLDKNNIVNADDFSFKLANGVINGSINYNLNEFKLDSSINIKNADSQMIAEDFFDMSNQMYGNIDGNVNISCNGASSVECLNTLHGQGNFNIKDGRMPKLGSLEYLLKAGDLITGGFTGLSINGIIDLITPLKTGNFDSIKGIVNVKDGIANDIEIFSSGKDLNMYLTGSYNFINLIADMEVYGSISKDFSTMLGKISNASLNRLLNTIPGISINEINPRSTSNIPKIPNFNKESVVRVFKAEIFGDINGSNYVKSFRWIKH